MTPTFSHRDDRLFELSAMSHWVCLSKETIAWHHWLAAVMGWSQSFEAAICWSAVVTPWQTSLGRSK
jgi:hypothetical protein